MKTEDLKPGMYVISEDVANPKADRRKSSRNFGAQSVWAKGTRVVVTEGLYGELRIHPPQIYSHLGVSGRNGHPMNNPAFETLAAALKPAKQTHREWVQVHVSCPDRILVKLLEAGRITRQDVLDAKKVEEK